MSSSVVYFIRRSGEALVKIGVTKGLDGRVGNLQSASDKPLEVLRTIAGGRTVERWLHHHYAERRRAGEWFEYCPSMLSIKPDEREPAVIRNRHPRTITPLAQQTVAKMVKYATAIRGSVEDVARAAALIGIKPRRLIGFLRGEILRVWEDELRDARTAYRALLDRQQVELLAKVNELRTEADKIDAEVRYEEELIAHLRAARASSPMQSAA